MAPRPSCTGQASDSVLADLQACRSAGFCFFQLHGARADYLLNHRLCLYFPISKILIFGVLSWLFEINASTPLGL